jgi:hypothetical protein
VEPQGTTVSITHGTSDRGLVSTNWLRRATAPLRPFDCVIFVQERLSGSLCVLVNVNPAPYVRYVILTENHQTGVSHDAAAVARWDDEGGAFMSARSNTGVRVSKDVRSKRMVEATAHLKVDQAPAEDAKILESLGAAVIMRWDPSRPKSNANSSNTRLRWPILGRQLRRRARLRVSCMTTRMTAIDAARALLNA